jgi:hypothetical protein
LEKIVTTGKQRFTRPTGTGRKNECSRSSDLDRRLLKFLVRNLAANDPPQNRKIPTALAGSSAAELFG